VTCVFQDQRERGDRIVVVIGEYHAQPPASMSAMEELLSGPC